MPKIEKKRRKKSAGLERFLKVIEELNDFYWGVRATQDSLKYLRDSGQTYKKFLSNSVRPHWNLADEEIDKRINVQLRRLEYYCIVDLVAHYEEYIKTIVEHTFKSRALPSDKMKKLEIVFSDATRQISAEEFVKSAWVRDTVENVLSLPYERRLPGIEQKLGLTPRKEEENGRYRTAAITFLVRNCIIHSAGFADDRLLSLAKGSFLSVRIQNQIEVQSDSLWKMFEALHWHARDIDNRILNVAPLRKR